MRFILLCALVASSANPSVCGAQDSSAFHSPDIQYRPKFRYWIPDASVSSSIVQQDIASVAMVGAGGFELVPYYQYGFPESDRGVPTPTNWSEYGFGTDAFRQVFLAALQATEKHGLSMDFALGANQGQGCPAEPESLGLAVELAYSNVTVAPGHTFNGTLPLSRQPDNLLGSIMHKLEEFGQQNLSAVVAVEIKDRAESPTTYPTNILGRVVDLTSFIKSDRSLTWTAPAGNSTWRLMAWYERYANQKNVAPGLNATNYIQNGSWVVDHFSTAGSRKMTDFFDQHVVSDDQSRQLLAAVGGNGWEDSLEMQSSLWWTPDFQRKFQEGRGYSVVRCLPFLITTKNYWIQAIAPYGEVFTSLNQSVAEDCIEDYRTTLNEGYQRYLSHYVEWAHSRGIKYSAQPGYNLPLNMLDDVPILDAPEGESLGFNNIPDTYRQLSGPAHFAGNSLVSSECGALSGAPYTQTMNDLLWSVRRGLATGISMNVLHGFAYSGPYANTTWPSYTTFTYRYTEMWNQNQPAWQHMNDTIMYIARNQYVAQIGTPKVDLAFYQYSSPWAAEESYQNTNLQNLGYTYEYISHGSLQSEHAVMQDGVLAPSGPAYKALIFSNQTSITPRAATKIKEFALAGLPIFFVGTANLTSIGKTPGDAQNVSSTMDEILSAGSKVHTVNSAEELPEALKAALVMPKTSFPTPMVGWFTFWRKTEYADYVFLYNDGNETRTSEVTFNTSGTPYLFDAWTGSVSPILHYSSTASTISIPITLAANQTSIIGFATSVSNGTSTFPPAPETFISSITGAVKGLRYNGSAISAQISGPSSVVLSSGKAVNLTASPPDVSNLTSWDIAIQDWHRTNNTFSMDTAIDLHAYTNSTLGPWTSLDPALAGVSGIGTYSTKFAYPTSSHDKPHLGALLHLGPIMNTVRVWLNGEMLPPADVTNAVIDITEYLHVGDNNLKIEVASTLFNRIKADGNATWTAGVTANEENSRFYEGNEYKEFGLVGPVWVEWVMEAVVA